MRIPEADRTPRISPSPGVSQPATHNPVNIQATPLSTSAPETLIGRLTALLSGLGRDISPSQMGELAGQLENMGFTPSELDRDGALRALFLNRNSVPLTSALLQSPSFPESSALLRQATSLLEEAVSLLGGKGLTVDVRTAVESLVQDMKNLLGGNVPVSGWLGGMLREKGEESPVLTASVLEGLWRNDAEEDGFGNSLRKSGLTFEWRLLSWYRSGRDPGMFHDLLRGDLKGILFQFLGRMEKVKGGENLAEKLEERARLLLDGITARQLNHLIDGSGTGKTLPLVVPAFEPRERMYAGIRVDGRKQRDDTAFEQELFSISLDLETTHLGTVRVHLRFSGKTTSSTFILKDRRTLALATGMADEFRGMLRDRGYEPGAIHFTLAGSESAYPDETRDSRNSLDIQG